MATNVLATMFLLIAVPVLGVFLYFLYTGEVSVMFCLDCHRERGKWLEKRAARLREALKATEERLVEMKKK